MIRASLLAICLVSMLPAAAYAASVTANVNLPRGSIIKQKDIDIKTASGESRDDVVSSYVGKELKRTIPKGYKLNPAYVGNPILVRRNARVNMIYRIGAMELSAWGRALGEGGTGDIISVMNLDSRKRVQGRILESGRIEVGQ